MAKQQIRYFLHDELGVKVGEVALDSYNYSTIIIEHNKICYRPIHYDLFSKTAVCVPVKKITIEDAYEAARTEGQSAFAAATKN